MNMQSLFTELSALLPLIHISFICLSQSATTNARQALFLQHYAFLLSYAIKVINVKILLL